MRRVVAVVALLMASSPAAMASPERMSAPAVSSSGALSVVVDRTAISSSLGDHLSFASTVRNGTGQLTSGLVAHLNVFSLDPNTYVDPEDWSSHRTQFLDPLPSRGKVSLTWPLQAVNSGSLVIYVAVTDTENRSIVVSKPIELTVEQKQTINAGGVLPVVVGMPVGVAALLALSVLRRRTQNRADSAKP